MQGLRLMRRLRLSSALRVLPSLALPQPHPGPKRKPIDYFASPADLAANSVMRTASSSGFGRREGNFVCELLRFRLTVGTFRVWFR